MNKKFLELQYEDKLGMIISVVARFHKRYGGDWDELFSTANYAYVYAMYTYDSGKASSNTHVWLTVWRFLQTELRNNINRCARECVDGSHSVLTPDRERSCFSWDDFKDSLSADAFTVVAIVMRRYNEFSRLARKTVKQRLRKALHRKGWSDLRIENTFAAVARRL